MESNKTKEALTVDYIFIPFSNQNDIEINEGDLEERYEALKTCLLTLERYECNRLR